MDNIAFTLTIGIIGSVIGAALVSFGQIGWRITRESFQAAQERIDLESKTYAEGDRQTKSAITNEYLFSSLRYLFVANLAWILPEFADSALNTSISTGVTIIDREETWIGYWWFSLICKGFGILFFYVGLGRILRYLKVIAGYKARDSDA